MRAKLEELHPGKDIEIERRIFMRVYDDGLCVDVRNLPDQ